MCHIGRLPSTTWCYTTPQSTYQEMARDQFIAGPCSPTTTSTMKSGHVTWPLFVWSKATTNNIIPTLRPPPKWSTNNKNKNNCPSPAPMSHQRDNCRCRQPLPYRSLDADVDIADASQTTSMSSRGGGSYQQLQSQCQLQASVPTTGVPPLESTEASAQWGHS